MKTRQMTHFFSNFFSSTCMRHWFLYLKIIKVRFHVVSPLVECGLQNTWIFGQRLPIWTLHHSILERHPDNTKNLYYVCSARGAENQSFQWFLAHEIWVQFIWVFFLFQNFDPINLLHLIWVKHCSLLVS